MGAYQAFRRLSMICKCVALSILLGIGGSAFAESKGGKAKSFSSESKAQFEARTKWWREAKFGMFIHWGVYAVPADATLKDGVKKGIAEWYFSNKQMQKADYQKFAPKFNPEKFDAKKWVETAKNAGMKYIVVTSKNHDGFDMCGTKLNHHWTILSLQTFQPTPMKAPATSST